jgi:hypothetical protein
MVVMHCYLAGLLGQTPAPPADPCDRLQRAGCPQTVGWWAIPSDTGAYAAYRVGGGCPCPRLADPPQPDEGTWGWDYLGRWFHRHVILGWWHDRRYQGGTGSYQTDGPSLNHGEGTLHHHDGP